MQGAYEATLSNYDLQITFLINLSSSGCEAVLRLYEIDGISVFPFLLIFLHLCTASSLAKYQAIFRHFQSPLLHPFFLLCFGQKKSFKINL